jgi:hypothetical protein
LRSFFISRTVSSLLQSSYIDVSRIIFSALVLAFAEAVVKAALEAVIAGLLSTGTINSNPFWELLSRRGRSGRSGICELRAA